MKVQIFPKRGNNMYLIINEASQEAAVVDPVDPDTVVTAVEENKVSLTKVLNTSFNLYQHEVYARLCEKFNDLQVYGGDDRIDSLTCKVKHDDIFNIGKLQVQCLATPSLTGRDICYYITGGRNTPAVYTGITLSVGGCDGFLGFRAEQLYRAFIEILGSLSYKTKVYCHEDFFTETRLKFAQSVEPENQIIRYKLEWVRRMQLEKNNPIVPNTIQVEKLTNPFMQMDEQSVTDHTGEKDPIKIMASLKREWQSFKP